MTTLSAAAVKATVQALIGQQQQCTATLTYRTGDGQLRKAVVRISAHGRNYRVQAVEASATLPYDTIPHDLLGITEILGSQAQPPRPRVDAHYPVSIKLEPPDDSAQCLASLAAEPPTPRPPHRFLEIVYTVHHSPDLVDLLQVPIEVDQTMTDPVVWCESVAEELAESPVAGFLVALPLQSGRFDPGFQHNPEKMLQGPFSQQYGSQLPLMLHFLHCVKAAHDAAENQDSYRYRWLSMLIEPICIRARELTSATAIPSPPHTPVLGVCAASGRGRADGLSEPCSPAGGPLMHAACNHVIHRTCAVEIRSAAAPAEPVLCPDCQCGQLLWFEHDPRPPPLPAPPPGPAAAAAPPRDLAPDMTRCTCKQGKTGRAAQGQHAHNCPRGMQLAAQRHLRTVEEREKRRRAPSDDATREDTAPAAAPGPPPDPAPPDPVSPQRLQSAPGTVCATQMSITYGDIIEVRDLACLKKVPDRCINAAAKMVGEVLGLIRYGGALADNAMVLYAAIPRLVFGKPVPAAAGRDECISDLVFRRMHLITTDAGRTSLLAEARNTLQARTENRRQVEVPSLPAVIPESEPMDPLCFLEAPITPDPKSFTRADRHFEWGEYSRGIRAMTAKPTALENAQTVAAMRRLHPTGGLPSTAPRDETFPRCTIEVKQADVKRKLHSFDKGTNGGLSGWTPELMQDLARAPCSSYLENLAVLVQRIVRGQVDSPHREFIFSANGFANYKDAGTAELPPGIRPLASGEVLRRMAGKLVVANVNGTAASHLLPRGQVAVGVKGGAEAAIHAATATVANFRVNPEATHDHVYLQTDRRNAFNLVSRGKFLEACRQHVPQAYPYAVAAYEVATTVWYGKSPISSESGCQQGCPLAMLLYALAEAAADDRIADVLKEALTFRVSYADDCNMSGPVDAVAAYHREQLRLAAEYGFEYNSNKYKLACHPEFAATALEKLGLPETCFQSLDNVKVLGTAVGSPEAVAAHAKTLVSKAACAITRFALLPNAHRASAALFYGGKGLITHQLRTSQLPPGEVQRLDDVFIETASVIHGVSDPTTETITRLSMPYKEGGWGYRRALPYMDLAFLASVSETKSMARALTKAPLSLLRADAATARVTEAIGSTNQLARELNAHCSASTASATRGLQKKWSAALNVLTHEQRLRDAGVSSNRDIQRLASCAGSWQALHPLITRHQPWRTEWLNNAQLHAITRHRLGLDIYPNDGRCGLCAKQCGDAQGDHAGVCMIGGHRSVAHNKVAVTLFQALSKGLCQPRREVMCFPQTDPRARLDIVCEALSFGGAKPAIDIAITGDFASIPSDPDELTVPGASATRYEMVKWRRYGKSVLNCPSQFGISHRPGDGPISLVPFVVDIYGAMGKSAQEFLPQVAKRLTHRLQCNYGMMLNALRAKVVLTVQRQMADIFLLADTTPRDFGAIHG